MNAKRYLFFGLFFLMGMTLHGLAYEIVEDETPIVTTHLFEIEELDIQSAKESVERLLSSDATIGAHVELFTVERPEGSFAFLAVQDTPEKIKEIGVAIKQFEAESVSQSLTVSMNFSDVPLNQVLATIAQAYDLNIVGGEELSQKASIYLKDIPIEDVFEVVLKATGYTYIKEGNIIWIVLKEALMPPLVTEVFNLEFASAEKVREAVSHLGTSDGSIKSFINYGEDKYSDTLIITDTTEAINDMKKVIKKLDRKIGQIIIEVKFAEVTLDKDDEVGIDWVLQASAVGTDFVTTFPFNADGTKVFGETSLALPDGTLTTTPAFSLGTMTFSDFTATIKLIDTESIVNLVASPRLAARDGEESEIIIGDIVPIPTYERNEETGSIEVTGYQEEKVGTLLRVTPMINDDRTITLVVHPEVSEITGSTGPNSERPIISTREVTTSFTIENGRTAVIGGLRKETITNTTKQVPVLGKLFGWIPFLGRTVSYKDDATDTKELVIFITPTIVKEKIASHKVTRGKGG